jgi:hypothetical protein
MSVNRVEAIVDAIAHLKGFSTNPDGDLYQIRSPLGMPNFSRPGKNEIDDQGRRVFSSALAGYRAATHDVQLKCKGESRAGLKTEDNLENLLRVYGIKESLGMTQVVRYLRRALKNQEVSLDTPLAWFMEGNE